MFIVILHHIDSELPSYTTLSLSLFNGPLKLCGRRKHARTTFETREKAQAAIDRTIALYAQHPEWDNMIPDQVTFEIVEE